VIVVNNPNNPTGRYHDEAAMRAVYDVAVDHDAYLLLGRGTACSPRSRSRRSRASGPTEFRRRVSPKRTGSPGSDSAGSPAPRRSSSARRWKDYTTISPSLFGQHVAKQALGRREPRILEENRELAETNRAIVADWLDRHDRLVRPGRRQRVRHGARWVRRRRGVLPGRRRDGERRARARAGCSASRTASGSGSGPRPQSWRRACSG